MFDTTNNRKTAVQPSKSKKASTQATTVNEILEKSREMFGFSAMAFVRIEFDVRIFGSCVFVYTKIVHWNLRNGKVFFNAYSLRFSIVQRIGTFTSPSNCQFKIEEINLPFIVILESIDLKTWRWTLPPHWFGLCVSKYNGQTTIY